jgi:hypothetical protein
VVIILLTIFLQQCMFISARLGIKIQVHLSIGLFSPIVLRLPPSPRCALRRVQRAATLQRATERCWRHCALTETVQAVPCLSHV